MKRTPEKSTIRHTPAMITLCRQRGFSLVEILVAITLSLILLAGVLTVMYSSKVT